MKSVVITGATSMIVSSIIDVIMEVSPETRIYAVVRECSARISHIPESENVSLIECSADRYDRLSNLINEKCDVFYHLAWTATGHHRADNIKEQERNIAYTLDALKAAKELGCKKFIGVGSQAECGASSIEGRCAA